MWPASISFDLDPGEYTLQISAYGNTQTKTFTMERSNNSTVNLADLFCRIDMSCEFPMKNVRFEGYTISSTSSYSKTHSFYVLREKTVSISATVDTPDDIMASLTNTSGVKTNHVLKTYAVYGQYTDAMSSNVTYNYPVDLENKTVTILESGTLALPSGTYNVALEGGGGGGSAGFDEDSGESGKEGGGGSGYIDYKSSVSLSGDYTLTLGNGGYPHTSGSASTLNGNGISMHASGGEAGGGYSGGSGGAGGGGVYAGNGTWGGGGGAYMNGRAGTSEKGDAGTSWVGGKGSSELAKALGIILGSGGVNSTGGGILAGGGGMGGGGGSLAGNGGSYNTDADPGAGGGGGRTPGSSGGYGGAGVLVIRPT